MKSGSRLVYQPKIVGAAKINFADAKTKINTARSQAFITAVTNGAIPVSWESAEEIAVPAAELEKAGQNGAQFGELAPAASREKSYAAWTKDFTTWVYGAQRLDLFRSPSLGEVSQPGEAERDFRIRLQQKARESRDEKVEALRKKYAPKIATLQERLRKAQANVEKQQSQARQAQMNTALSVGATILGAFTGRKAFSAGTISRASTAAGRAGRAMEEGKDVERAGDTVEAVQQQLNDLQAEFTAESNALAEKIDPMAEALETISVKPKKADISVQLVALAWAPYWQDAQGGLTPAW